MSRRTPTALPAVWAASTLPPDNLTLTLREIYEEICHRDDATLTRIISILERKFPGDADIAEVIATLIRWKSTHYPHWKPDGE